MILTYWLISTAHFITEGVYMCGDDICMILPQQIHVTIVSGK